MRWLSAFWRHITGCRQVGFEFGRCAWCEHYVPDLVPGEGLCEQHWLDTK
jgi:hypothetical protein